MVRRPRTAGRQQSNGSVLDRHVHVDEIKTGVVAGVVGVVQHEQADILRISLVINRSGATEVRATAAVSGNGSGEQVGVQVKRDASAAATTATDVRRTIAAIGGDSTGT